MRTFILCVGAKKSGTTWLFKQIIKSSNFRKGFSKEYHLFDALYLDNLDASIKNVSRRVKNYPFQEGEDYIKKHENLMLSFYEDEKKYFDYFDSLLIGNDCFTSDITPSYSGLSSAVLGNIKSEFFKRNINLKVIFLMREPITRLESAVRMQLKRNALLKNIDNREMVKRMYASINSKGDSLRGNYAYTCEQIDQVFPDDDVFYGFYETLFTHQEINRLSTFLDLEPEHFNAEEVVNSTAKPFKYSLQDMNNFKDLVSERYRFVEKRFNFDLNIWHKVTDALVKKDR